MPVGALSNAVQLAAPESRQQVGLVLDGAIVTSLGQAVRDELLLALLKGRLDPAPERHGRAVSTRWRPTSWRSSQVGASKLRTLATNADIL